MATPRKAPAKKRKTPTKKAPAKKATPRKRPTRAAPPMRFAQRGQRIWDHLHDRVVGEQGLALLEETCRTADRLDQLDRLLKGDDKIWFRLVHDLRTEDYELRIDSALIEARQQANVFRQLVTALPLKQEGGDGGGDPDPDGWLDDL